jgi:hypothetical protein
MTTDIPDCALRYRLRGGATGLLPISNETRGLLWRAIYQRDDNGRFAVFDSENRRVAINLDHLVYAQFVFDELLSWPYDREVPEAAFQVFLSISPEPLEFEVDSDSDLLSNEHANDDDVHLQDLLFTLDLAHAEPPLIHFEAVDHEEVILLTADVAMISIPWADLMLTNEADG